jgi:hypothetical protein
MHRELSACQPGWQGCDALSPGRGLWLYLAVVPEVPIPGRVDSATVRDAEQWWHGYRFRSPLGRRIDAYGSPLPAPGRVTFTDRRQSMQDTSIEPIGNYLELCVDGSAFAAICIIRPADQTGIGERELADDTVLLADATLQWVSRQAGSWGEVDLTIGLLDADADPGELSSPTPLTTAVHDIERPIRGTCTLDRVPSGEVSSDLTVCAIMQGRLAVAHAALSALLHWFGVAETTYLGADGTIFSQM